MLISYGVSIGISSFKENLSFLFIVDNSIPLSLSVSINELLSSPLTIKLLSDILKSSLQKGFIVLSKISIFFLI